jgi:hypothetical protein
LGGGGKGGERRREMVDGMGIIGEGFGSRGR